MTAKLGYCFGLAMAKSLKPPQILLLTLPITHDGTEQSFQNLLGLRLSFQRKMIQYLPW